MNYEGKKVLFIVNKFAGGGFQPTLEGRMIDVCARHDAECTIEFTRSRGHATELAQQAPKNDFAFVVAVGGDGTINEVARGALEANVPMGIIPRGSGNGLARHLGIPLTVEKGLETLFQSRVLNMDTFTVNGKLSLNVSGVGFDGHIANLFSHKTKRGLLGYAKLSLAEFLKFQEFDGTLEIDGKSFAHRLFILAIANSSQYGNNARVAPLASVCDEILHVNIIKKIPLYRIDIMADLFKGKLSTSKYCEIVEGKKMRFVSTKPVPYHVDGEPCGEGQNFEIVIQPAALQVLVPEKTEGGRVL